MVSSACDRGCIYFHVLMCVLCICVAQTCLVGKFDLGGVLNYIIRII